MERDDMMRQAAARFGYERIGSSIRDTLKGHMRAAIRRGILEADHDYVRAWTVTMSDYSRDELRDTLCSVMRKGNTYGREETIYATAHHLGFKRVSETVRAPIKSAINSAIRQGVLDYQGSEIWREE